MTRTVTTVANANAAANMAGGMGVARGGEEGAGR